jgi:hypothetical protein
MKQYIPHKPSYKYELIFDLDLADNYYLSRGHSGFNFYWRSTTNVSYPE